MHSTTASVHCTNKWQDIHNQIHHKWISPSYVCLYYWPIQPQQSNGTSQEPMKKYLIRPLQPRRSKSCLTIKIYWNARIYITNISYLCCPHQPRELFKHSVPHNRTAKQTHITYSKRINTVIRIIPMFPKITLYKLTNTIKPIYIVLLNNELNVFNNFSVIQIMD